jgi:hypothetical protein
MDANSGEVWISSEEAMEGSAGPIDWGKLKAPRLHSQKSMAESLRSGRSIKCEQPVTTPEAVVR